MQNLRNKYSFQLGRKLSLILAVTLLLPGLAIAQTTQIPDAAKTQPRAAAYAGLEMLTPDEGTDFSGYLRSVYLGIKREWFTQMPSSVEKGEQGIVQVEFRVQRNGSVPADFVKLAKSSGKDDLDRAARGAVQSAASFSPLPDKFSHPFIELRMTFLYNIDPRKIQRP